MTKSLGSKSVRLIAAIALGAVVLVSCARMGTGGAIARPLDVYAAGPSVADVRSLLGNSTWWPGPPTFYVPPLDAAVTPFTERFGIVQRYQNVGTAETLIVHYTVFDKNSSAVTRMTDVQNALGTSVTGPKAGDQTLYYAQLARGGAPFGTTTFVRLGQIVISIGWTRKDGLPSLSQLGRIAATVVSRLKAVLAGKLHGTPLSLSDAALLPPPGPDITLLGATRLPVEAIAEMLNIASPTDFVGLFQRFGVSNFVYGDFALDKDLHMEVRTAEFTFSSPADTTSWLDALVGKSALDSNGDYYAYSDPSGEYRAVITAGTHGAILICRSTVDSEAASRACEVPLQRVMGAWKQSLGTA